MKEKDWEKLNIVNTPKKLRSDVEYLIVEKEEFDKRYEDGIQEAIKLSVKHQCPVELPDSPPFYRCGCTDDLQESLYDVLRGMRGECEHEWEVLTDVPDGTTVKGEIPQWCPKCGEQYDPETKGVLKSSEYRKWKEKNQ